jgi:hypothetical protein
MRTGIDKMPRSLVLVRCLRCRVTAGLFRADGSGTGSWRHDNNRRCRCDPPPKLPEGAELDELVAQAWRSMRSDGRAAVTIFR